jgi:hypothetical protein
MADDIDIDTTSKRRIEMVGPVDRGDWGNKVAAALEDRSKSLAFQLANHKMLMAYLEKRGPRPPTAEGLEVLKELRWRPK